MSPMFSIEDRRRLAEVIGVGEPFLSQCLSGHRSMKAADARAAEEKTGGELMRWHLNSEWFAIWPELIGSDGAPKPPAGSKYKPSPKRADRATAAEPRHITQDEIDRRVLRPAVRVVSDRANGGHKEGR